MLQSLIGRWLGQPSPAHATAPPLGLVEPGVAAAHAAPVVGARRALIDASGAVAGYEFHVGQGLLRRLRARGDAIAARAHANALLASMRLCAQRGCIAYAELPASWLALLEPERAGGLQLCLRPVAPTEDATRLVQNVVAWRSAGARIGWPEDEPPVMRDRLSPDFIVRTGVCAPSARRSAGSAAAWVAPDLPDIEALETALGAGALWAGSSVKIGAEPRLAQALPPQVRHLMQLVRRLVRDDDTATVVDEIKRDAALSVRLLQHLNSPGISRGLALASIDQAVAVLGRDALYHWGSGMLVRLAPARTATASLQTLALARARLLESVAHGAGEAEPGSLYLMGLVSVLPLLLQISLAEALDSLQLPATAERALRHREGPWSHYLDLIDALEAPDLVAVRRLAAPVGGIDAVMAMSVRAWMPD